MESILEKLVNNSRKAIDNGIYEYFRIINKFRN